MTSTQVANLSTTFLNALGEPGLEYLTSTDIRALAIAQLNGLTTTNVGEIPNQFQYLTAAQVAGLSTTVLSALGIMGLGDLTSTEIQALGPAQINGLTTTILEDFGGGGPFRNFTSTQVANLTATTLSLLGPEVLNNLTSTEIGGLSAAQLNGLTTTVLGQLPMGALLGTLTTTQVAGLTAATLNAVGPGGLRRPDFDRSRRTEPGSAERVDHDQPVGIVDDVPSFAS